jgi:hypothetical protein
MAQDPKLARALARLHSVRGYSPELDVPVLPRLLRLGRERRREEAPNQDPEEHPPVHHGPPSGRVV